MLDCWIPIGMGFRLRLGVQDQKAIHLCARRADLELASPSAELSAFGVAGRFAGHVWLKMRYTFWEFNSLLLKMAIEIIDLPIKNSDFPCYVTVYQRVPAPKSSRQIHAKPKMGKMWKQGAIVGMCRSDADHDEMVMELLLINNQRSDTTAI